MRGGGEGSDISDVLEADLEGDQGYYGHCLLRQAVPFGVDGAWEE